MKKTHRSLISALMLAGLISPALLLNGCLDTGGSSASVTQGAQVAKASVGITVAFPAAGATAARIDQNTTTLRVQVWDATNQSCQEYGCFGDPNGSVDLQRPQNGGEVSGNITNISPGEAVVRVSQLDADGNVLETVNVSANLVEGDNAMTVTLIRAAWILESPVTFNKIVGTDTARIDSFSLVPTVYDDYGGLARASSEQGMLNLARGASFYGSVLKGSNLCSAEFIDFDDRGTVTCGQSQLVSNNYMFEGDGGIAYFSRHDSATPANNYAMLTAMNDDMPLADSNQRERGWMALSVGPDGQFLEMAQEDDGPVTASDPSVWSDFNIAVTAGDTIQGNFIEWLEKSYVTSNRSCYTWVYDGNQSIKQTINCPAQDAAAAKASTKQRGGSFRIAATKAIKTAQGKAGKAAANAQGCYLDLVIEYEEGDYGGWYQDGQSTVYWYYTEDVTETLDLCRHPFVAKASQLLQADIDLVNNGGDTPQPVRARARR